MIAYQTVSGITELTVGFIIGKKCLDEIQRKSAPSELAAIIYSFDLKLRTSDLTIRYTCSQEKNPKVKIKIITP